MGTSLTSVVPHHRYAQAWEEAGSYLDEIERQAARSEQVGVELDQVSERASERTRSMWWWLLLAHRSFVPPCMYHSVPAM